MLLRKARYAGVEARTGASTGTCTRAGLEKVIAAAMGLLLLVPARLTRHGSCYRWGKRRTGSVYCSFRAIRWGGMAEEGTFFLSFSNVHLHLFPLVQGSFDI